MPCASCRLVPRSVGRDHRWSGAAAGRHWRAIRLFVLLVLLLPGASAHAQGTDPSYSVGGVRVEATAQDAVAARAIAIEQAQRQALRQLLDRLGAPAGIDVSQAPIEDLVASFEVLEETVGPNSYAARLQVAFDREAVRELLDDRGLAYADATAEPVVVVPLWQTGRELLLWESDNAWKAAWDQTLQQNGLVPFVVPLGDLQDFALLNPDQAARADQGALQALAERYGAEAAIVARLEGSGAAGEPLEVSARRYGDDEGEPYRAVVRRPPDEPLAESLAGAVAETQAAFDARFRDRSVASRGPTEAVVLNAPVSDVSGWGRLLGMLNALAEVEDTDVRRFSQDGATLELRVVGGVERLRDRLGEQGWRLENTGDGILRLERGAAPSGTPTL